MNLSESITIDGTASSDANGDLLTYKWSVASSPLGSLALISDSTSPSPTFTPDYAGDYELHLMVNDGFFWSFTDSVLISAGSPWTKLTDDFGVTDFNGAETIDLSVQNPSILYSNSSFGQSAIIADYNSGTLSLIQSSGFSSFLSLSIR